MSSVDLDDLDG